MLEDQGLLAFLPRHKEVMTSPHMINYRANVYALKLSRWYLATNAVGSLNESLKPGEFLMQRFPGFHPTAFHIYNDRAVHVDVTQPYCPQLRN